MPARAATPAPLGRLADARRFRLAGLIRSHVSLTSTLDDLLRSLVEGVSEYDAGTLGAVIVLVFSASVVAACIPATLAARIAPAEVLRD